VKAVEEGWVEDEGLGLRAEWLMSTEEEDSWDDDDSLLVSTEEEPAMCGIRLVWVHRSHRRRGVGIYIFSKVLYIGTLYSKYIGALTYEDFCRY
jgi:GNAT superfamily N-acetyltransferase